MISDALPMTKIPQRSCGLPVCNYRFDFGLRLCLFLPDRSLSGDGLFGNLLVCSFPGGPAPGRLRPQTGRPAEGTNGAGSVSGPVTAAGDGFRRIIALQTVRFY